MSEPRSRLDEPLYGRYKVIRELGCGGMGIVHLAHDLRMRREVAIKRIHRTDGGGLERFRREFKALSAIRHRGVPTIYECGDTTKGEAFFTMEIVEGTTLVDVMRGGALAPVRALTLTIELGRILMAVHEAGIIHRDVKPSNIIIEPGDRVRLLDFGVCALTDDYYKLRPVTVVGQRFQSGDFEFVGDPAYSDPQHFNEGLTSPQNDVFSVCVILYELVTGRHLYSHDIMGHREIMAEEFAPELAPLAVELQRGVADTADNRHLTMVDLVRELEIVRSKLATPRVPPPPTSRARRLALGAALVVAFTLGRFSGELLAAPTHAPSPAEVGASTTPPSLIPPEVGAVSPTSSSAASGASLPAEEEAPAERPRVKSRTRIRRTGAESWDDRMARAEAHARRCLKGRGVALQPLKVALEPDTPARVRGFTSTAPETECVRAALQRFELHVADGQRMHTFFADRRPR
ncbi:serine/threonine protein kinase [Nannocystis punicea]|uniref:Serine/threonine-protein kinase n=1 Tax=Nannocystis punicea TaxID=2995304 RepID=A0ABY7HBR5_9BACT|nr:serine/threonine-protein kinase [Nannocystis poenicansa]WAS96535.1 serine/threonine-protein kinase [Nannocystis poenicansa]